MARRRWPGGLYVWRTRKPGAAFGWPIVGRHFAYVGKTSSFYHREQQHAQTKDWFDLDPKCYTIPMPGRYLRGVLEPLLIMALFPAYNDKWNKHNPRRITLSRARAQRVARDSGSRLLRIATAFRPLHAFIVTALALGSVGMWLR